MPLRQEVLGFISACEAIQEFLAVGDILTEDEQGVLELETRDLLEKLLNKSGSGAA